MRLTVPPRVAQPAHHFLIEIAMLMAAAMMMMKLDILTGKNALKVNHHILPLRTPIIVKPNVKKTTKLRLNLILVVAVMLPCLEAMIIPWG
jgi:hypothetical protein